MPDVPLTPGRLKTRVRAAELPSLTSLMTLAVGVVVIAALYLAREVLIPITLAILLSFVLAPLVNRLRRLGLWRVPAVFLAVLLALGVIAGLGLVIGTQVAALGRQAPSYAYVIEQKLNDVRTVLNDQFSSITSRLSHMPAPGSKPPERQGGQQDGPPEQKPLPVEVHAPEPTPFQMLERWATPLLAPLGSVGIMLVVCIFILMQLEDLRNRMIRLFGSGDLHRTTAAMDDAARRLSRYFLAQLALNASFGVLVAIALFAIGIPSPALFGIIAALFRFVPYVGAFGATVLPVLLAAAVDPGWSTVLITLGTFVVLETLVGQVAEPLAYGHSTGLSPVSVVIAAIFWTWLWGPVGLILSMPLTLCLVVLGRHVDHLQFIDVLLGDRPALTPAESFYQRILAGDADEAMDQAETLLRTCPLSAYYDDVALQALQMAANDKVRGVLSDTELRHIHDTVGAIVTDLSDQSEPGPVAEHGPGVVLCVAGRGPLDEAACTMLAQILAKRGLNARIVSHEAAGRGSIDGLDVANVRAVCVSWLEAAGSLSGLRYLVRRLHRRLPDVPVLIGMWQAEANVVEHDRLIDVIGTDRIATSLRDAIDACQAAVAAQPATPDALARV